uniref:Rab-GAP TBC domain-containing protein n=2 Tax=Lotharella globosa TaxID=91324 RepID=A0A7S3Z688_9EUKA
MIDSVAESVLAHTRVESRLPAVEMYDAVPQLDKIDQKKHTQMKSQLRDGMKDIAVVMNNNNKSAQSAVNAKKKKRDFRREMKWVEMKKYYEKHHKWQSSQKLKERVRKGIPQSLRGYAWLRLMGADKKIIENRGLYQKLSLVPKPDGDVEPFRTIDRDVPRTFPDNTYLHGDDNKASAAERLREVLYAYVHYDKQVQYCQGMNLVAAFLMISCPFQNEEVFWMLERLCHHPDYYLQALYGPNLELAFEFEYVLKKLVKSFLPRLYKAIKKADAHLGPMLPFGSINVFAPKWVISLWSILPSNCAVRIWDIFFNEGHKILYRVALYVLMHTQKDIIAVSNEKAMESGDYLEMLSMMKQSDYIAKLDIWKDEDAMVHAMFKLTHGLRNGAIATHKKRFWKAKKKEQLELEIKENRSKKGQKTKPKK